MPCNTKKHGSLQEVLYMAAKAQGKKKVEKTKKSAPKSSKKKASGKKPR